MPWGRNKFTKSQKRPSWGGQRRCNAYWNFSFDSSLNDANDIDTLLNAIRSPNAMNGSFTETAIVSLDDTDQIHQQCLGTVRGHIVGLQYYTGEVFPKEMVALVREPTNRYDPNAVKVENVWGDQVGHIKREIAKPLAHIVDNRLARIEGVVPSGVNNQWRIPVDITLWGPPENYEAAKNKLSRHGFYLTGGVGAGNMEYSQSSGFGGRSAVYNPRSVLSSSVKLSQAEMKNELDKLFEDMKGENKVSVQEPSKAIISSLYKHQKQGLYWMISRENSKDLPPFWEQRGFKFFNTLTNFMSDKKPDGVCGGILADDMGLGKTLTMISVILTNSRDGQPVFVEGTSAEISTVNPNSSHALSSLPQLPSLPKASSETDFAKPVIQHPPFTQLLQKENISSVGNEIEKIAVESVVQHVLGTIIIENDPVKNYDPVKDDVKEFVSGDSNIKVSDTKELIQKGSKTDDDVIVLDDGDSDPDYDPVSQAKKNKQSSPVKIQSTGRPKRAAKKPTRYVFSDEDDGADLEEEVPKKKPKKGSKVKGEGKKQKKVPKAETKMVVGDFETEKVGATENVATNEKDITIKKVGGTEKAVDAAKVVAAEKVIAKTKRPKKKEKTSKSSVKQKPVEFVGPEMKRRLNHEEGKPTATLIVCPVSVLGNWVGQFEEHVHPSVELQLHVYHGHSRSCSATVLATKDAVITTYSTLAAEYKAKKDRSPLQKVTWLRIVLDEAHMIRNPNAQQTKAVHSLNSERKWALTGTPIQNNIKDLWSLMAFIGLEPFKSNRQWWQRIIERPISQGDQSAVTKVRKLMDVLALRRTKTQKVDGKLLVELPAKNVILQYIQLSEDERMMYDTMAKDGKLAVTKYFSRGQLMNHYGDVLAILLRLRQLCCHPCLCAQAAARLASTGNEGSSAEEKKKLIDTLLALLSEGSDEECCICMDSLHQPVITPCAHVFCHKCILEVIAIERDETKCPLCRGQINEQKLVQVPTEQTREVGSDAVEGEWHSSAKVDALLECLIQERAKDPSTKSLVVSQFTSFLSVLQKPLREKGFRFVRLDGSMTMAKRNESIREFSSSEPHSPTVILLSLKAGGQGINLIAATRVYLMDPAWNPAVEEQCFDRCHRLGQTKEVTVTKFIIKDSVEERMLELQEKKRTLMSQAFGTKISHDQRRQTRINDVKALFGI